MDVTGHTRRPPSIRDVATAAGVSYQTVSRVINGHPSVRPATRDRVSRVIEELGFRRSVTALALASGRSRSVTVLTSHTTRYGYASVVQGVEEAARRASYAVGVSVLEPGDEQAQAAAVQRAGDAAGGLIVIAYDAAGVAALAAVEPGTPVVGVVETPSTTPPPTGPGCGPTTTRRRTRPPRTCSRSATRRCTTWPSRRAPARGAPGPPAGSGRWRTPGRPCPTWCGAAGNRPAGEARGCCWPATRGSPPSCAATTIWRSA